jgi:macrodomain Ter protein organizer (MatP/YcbG family)
MDATTQKHFFVRTQFHISAKITRVSVVTQKKRWMMDNAETKRPKTIGVTNEVWRELKLLSMDRDETLSETIDYLLKKGEKTDGAPTEAAGKTRKKSGAKPA